VSALAFQDFDPGPEPYRRLFQSNQQYSALTFWFDRNYIASVDPGSFSGFGRDHHLASPIYRGMHDQKYNVSIAYKQAVRTAVRPSEARITMQERFRSPNQRESVLVSPSIKTMFRHRLD
jgi:hypothetical protein